MTRMERAAPSSRRVRRATRAPRIRSDSVGIVAMMRRSSATGMTITSPGSADPGGEVDPLPGQEVELAEEAAGVVDGHHCSSPS